MSDVVEGGRGCCLPCFQAKPQICVPSSENCWLRACMEGSFASVKNFGVCDLFNGEHERFARYLMHCCYQVSMLLSSLRVMLPLGSCRNGLSKGSS